MTEKSKKIQHFRGLEANLPILEEGRIAFTTDTNKIFIGSNSGNVEFSNKQKIEEIIALLNLDIDSISEDIDVVNNAIDGINTTITNIINNSASITKSLETQLPVLSEGKFGFSTDTKKIFIGSNSGNVELAKKKDLDKVSGFINAKEFGVQPSNTVGVSDNLQALINKVRTDFISSGLTIQPTIHFEAGVYLLDKEVKMSPFIKFKALGTVVFKVAHNGTGIHIVPNLTDPTYDGSSSSPHPAHFKKQFWNRGKYFEGSFIFTSDIPFTDANTKTIAIEIGARDDSLGSGRPISRYTIEQVNVFGVSTAFKLNTYSHYIGTFENCHIEHMKHAIVWGDEDGENKNSGEKFAFKDCLIAGSHESPVLLNGSGIDIAFVNTSFDFNEGAIFRVKRSGVCIALTDSYVEAIEGNNPILLSCTPTSGASWGRNSLTFNGVRMLLDYNGKIMENLPNQETGKTIEYSVSIDSLEVRYNYDLSRQPIPINKAYLFDTNENISLYGKGLIMHNEQHAVLSEDLDLSVDGDFALTSNEADTYWKIDDSSGGINLAVGSNGVDGSKSLDVTIGNTTTFKYISIMGGHKIPAKAGQFAVIMPSVKAPQIDSGFCAECYAVCYDASGKVIDSYTYYSYYVPSGTTTTFNEYHYPRFIPKIKLPKGTVSFIPYISFFSPANSITLNYSINNIFVSVIGD